MNFAMKILKFRLWLNLDPGARKANRRLAAFRFRMKQEHIRAKATTFQATSGDEIIAQPIAAEDHVVSVFEMPRAEKPRAEKPEPAPYKLDDTGIDVVFDPTDPVTMELMREHEFGSITNRDAEAVFQNQVDNNPPEEVDFEFEWTGIKNLG